MYKKIFNGKVLVTIIFITLILSSIFVAVEIVLAPITATENDISVRVKSDYILMFSQCILGVFALLLPGRLKKHWHIYIPSKMIIIYALFLYCAIYLGEVRSFYYDVPHWDTILHAFSGAMLGALGFSFISFLNKTENVPINLSPIFVAVFTLCFAVTLGVIWEIYEFSADIVLGTNMQKFSLEGGEALIGQDALKDTMKDLIVDTIGAFVMSVIGYISLKYQKGWLEKLQLKFNKS